MERLVEVGLSNALMAAVLAVVTAMVSLVCRRPAVVHALWVLVLLKLVTPPLVLVHVFSPVPPQLEQEATEMVESAPAPAVTDEELSRVVAANTDIKDLECEDGDETADEEPAEMAVPVQPENVPADSVAQAWRIPGEWFNVLAWVWVIGSLSWFALASRRVWRFSRALRHARPSLAMQDRVAQLANRIGLHRCPLVRMLPGRLSPMIWGVGRPILVLPEGLETQVSTGGLDTLILHELAHLHRRDHWVRWLDFLALGLFWWNPVAWYARRELREAEEQCCDAWVVRTLPGAGRAYATALVDAIDFLCEACPALPPLASGLGQVADLKRRLTMILRGNTPTGLGRSNGLMVCGLALFLLPLMPVWGQAQKETEDNKKRVVEVLLQRKAETDDMDLKRLHVEIERKAAELAVLKAKLEALAQKAKAEAQAKSAAADLVNRRSAFQLARGAANKVSTSGPVIRIEISGLDMKAEALKELVSTLEKVLPGKDKRVFLAVGSDRKAGAVITGQGGAFSYRFEKGQLTKERADSSPTPRPPVIISRPEPPGAFAGKASSPAAGTADKKIDGLEKKLDMLLRELESIRREMRRAPRGGAGGGGFGGGTGASGGFPGAAGKRAGSSTGEKTVPDRPKPAAGRGNSDGAQ